MGEKFHKPSVLRPRALLHPSRPTRVRGRLLVPATSGISASDPRMKAGTLHQSLNHRTHTDAMGRKPDLFRRLPGNRSPIRHPSCKETLSTMARSQSILPLRANSVRNSTSSRRHTPRRCRLLRWHRQVYPESQSLVAGRCSQGTPARGVKTIPVSTFRGSLGFPAAYRRCRFLTLGLGNKGSILLHSRSLTIGSGICFSLEKHQHPYGRQSC